MRCVPATRKTWLAKFRGSRGSLGVYHCQWGTDAVRVVVAGQLPRESHNAPLHLFSASPELVGFGRSAYQRRRENTSGVLGQLFDALSRGGFGDVVYDGGFPAAVRPGRFRGLTPEEQREALERLPPRRRQELLERCRPRSG